MNAAPAIPPERNSMVTLQQYAQEELSRSREPISCKICAGETTLFDVVDFGKTSEAMKDGDQLLSIPVYYSRCCDCGFIFTKFFDRLEPAQWTEWVYNKVYYERVDPDYEELRPRGNAFVVNSLLIEKKDKVIGLDYGGGSGRAAELLRDMGYRYDSFDPFGKRLMTPQFAQRYEFCSAFEVAEHTPDPVKMLREILAFCSPGRLAILVGTHTTDGNVNEGGRLAWWYAAPRNGHISLYSKKALQRLALQEHLQCINLTEQTHLLYREMSQREALFFLLKGKVRGRIHRLLNLKF